MNSTYNEAAGGISEEKKYCLAFKFAEQFY